MEKELIIREKTLIHAPAAAVWDVLVNPEQTRKYMFGCEPVSGWKPGDPLLWKGVFDGKELVVVKGTVKAFKNEKLFDLHRH